MALLQETWPQISPDLASQFARDGFLIIREFATRETCEAIRASILDFTRREELIRVRWPQSTFDTFNSSQVDENFPGLSDLYDRHLLEQLLHLSRLPLATVADRRVGLSINLTSIGGKFEPHFDRHILTAILYVNDDYTGGEMMLFPRVRYWLGHPAGRLQRRLQRVLDRLTRDRNYLRWFAKKKTLKPNRGDLLIFEGTKTYHAVTPVGTGSTRLSIQFAYDKPGMMFDVSGYYGK